MLRHALIVLAFYFGSAATVFAAGPLNEVRKVVHHRRQTYPA
jgi:hypothetical protein